MVLHRNDRKGPDRKSPMIGEELTKEKKPKWVPRELSHSDVKRYEKLQALEIVLRAAKKNSSRGVSRRIEWCQETERWRHVHNRERVVHSD